VRWRDEEGVVAAVRVCERAGGRGGAVDGATDRSDAGDAAVDDPAGGRAGLIRGDRAGSGGCAAVCECATFGVVRRRDAAGAFEWGPDAVGSVAAGRESDFEVGVFGGGQLCGSAPAGASVSACEPVV